MQLHTESTFSVYLALLKKGEVQGYPESTSPISIDVAGYIERCVNGEVGVVMHYLNFETPDDADHGKAKLAEEFFAEQVQAFVQRPKEFAGIV